MLHEIAHGLSGIGNHNSVFYDTLGPMLAQEGYTFEFMKEREVIYADDWKAYFKE